MSDQNRSYDVFVHHPDNPKKPTLKYTYEDLNSAEEAFGFLAVWHVKVKDGVRRTFEIKPVPLPPQEVKDDSTDPASGTDESRE